MKKRMFSKFTNILQNAVDALAPQLSLQEEFVLHWKAVTTFFIEHKGEKVPVDQTNIPAHLEQLLVLLQQEETECERGMYGPCLEYLLQHKLLDTLYSLGRTDYPPGMKQIVLSFFTRLLSRIKQPLLAHVNVYKAVQRLIKTCGEVRAGPTEIEEIQFLCTVCAKIKADPYLVNFFLEVPRPSQGTTTSSKPVIEEPSGENKLQQEFHLVRTLLTLSHSEDSWVAVKACEGLILCSSLPDPVAAHCMVNSTSFCANLTQRLIQTYKKLPPEINPVDLENVQAKWGLEVVAQREDEQTFVGKRHLVSFLSWLDYVDQLSAIANPIVAEALARNIHQQFLLPYVKPDLLQMSEAGCITAMAYMSRCLRTVCSQRMLSEIVLFLLGDERKAENKGDNDDSLRSRLIDRCNSVSEEMSLISLQLFDTLLHKDDEHIVHNLVLRNLEKRDYYNPKTKRKSDHETEKGSKGNKTDDKTLDDSDIEKAGNMASAETMVDSERLEVKSEDKEIGSEANSDKTAADNTKGDVQYDNVASDKLKGENDTTDEVEAKLENESKDGKSMENESLDNVTDSKEVEKVENVKVNQDDSGNNEASVSDEMTSPENVVVPHEVKGCDAKGDHGEKQAEGKKLKISDRAASPFSTPLHVKTEVHKVVNSFLTLLPEELKSSYQTADSGYDMYLKDAHKQYSAILESSKSWGYPKDTSGVKGDLNSVFYEGLFLHMLLEKMSRMLDQSYPINLQLTSVISVLALVPHPCLHEFLLDPYLPVKPGTRNLFSVFVKISNDIKSQFSKEADLAQRLVRVRKKLMANNPSIHKMRVSSLGCLTRLTDDSRLEAIIVFEEFCKELSAIAFVKHHAAVTEESPAKTLK